MAYEKQIWENLPSTNTPISADRLNHMEEGIYEAWGHGGGGGGDTLPIGVILPLSSDTIPEGYLLCDGSEISRTTYSTLFSVIGTTYGVGDGSTTFNLPNLNGRVPVGQDSDDSDFDTLGETGGSKYLQAHKHSVEWSISDGNVENRVRLGSQSGGSGTGAYGYAINDNIDVQTGNSGNLQPYLVVKYIIKALNAQSGEIRSESLPVGTELDYDGETVPTGWEQVDDVPVYSTTETKCGTWIGGEPIYRKVINFTNTSTDWQTIDTINNIDEIIRLNGYVYDSGDNKTAIPSYGNDSVQFYIDTSGNIRKKSTSYYSNKTGMIILEYTKTTD